MSDLIGGFYPKEKHERAPDFVIGKLSINIQQFREWMAGYIKANPDSEWVNVDMKVSKAGKGYAVVDDWNPDKQSPPMDAPPAHAKKDDFFDDDIAF